LVALKASAFQDGDDRLVAGRDTGTGADRQKYPNPQAPHGSSRRYNTTFRRVMRRKGLRSVTGTLRFLTGLFDRGIVRRLHELGLDLGDEDPVLLAVGLRLLPL